jgi:ferrous iron transport protein B
MVKRKINVALAGQPNVGKSVIFNSLVGGSQIVGNWPGKTVEKAEGRLIYGDYEINVVDLPGTYSLSSYSEEEVIAREYILSRESDVVVNVVDASVLERNLYLTIQLFELEAPVIVALNLMDVAQSKGIRIDVDELSKILGVPVIPMVAVTGRGIDVLVKTIIDFVEGRVKVSPAKFKYGREVEEKISILSESIKKYLPQLCSKYPPRWLAIKLLEGDENVLKIVESLENGRIIILLVQEFVDELERIHGEKISSIISSERYSIISRDILPKVQFIERAPISRTFSDKLNYWTTHPILGYPILILVFLTIFYAVFTGGRLLEEALSYIFDENLMPWISGVISGILPETIYNIVINGFFGGLIATLTISLPYILPFYFILSILEDTGYMPRAAYLMDAFMHRIGLHGKAFLPLMLGYGCNVPACLGCRIMESDREKLLLSFLVVLIPCSARTVVILGIVGKYIGFTYALMLYLINIIVIVLFGYALNRLLPGCPVGLIMEMPDYRKPVLKAVVLKTWHRVKGFIYEASPLIVAGSVILETIYQLNMVPLISYYASPLISGLLGLPAVTAFPLIFGILRKELALILLQEVIGSSDLNLVLSVKQMLVFTVVVMFFIPCVATIAACVREEGWRRATLISLSTIVISVLAGWVTNIVLTFFFGL